MEHLFITLAVIAAVKLVDLIQAKDYFSAAKIILAACIGALIGWLGVDGMTLVTGIKAGLTASGLVTITKIAAE